MNHSDALCRPFRPRSCFSHVTTRLRAWLLPAGASRLECAPGQSKHKVPNHFQASLEEARVSRPGRKAGIVNGRNLERRRCGTGIMRAAPDAPIFSQLQRRAARRPERETRLAAICERDSEAVGAEGWRGSLWRESRILIGALSLGRRGPNALRTGLGMANVVD